MSAATRPVVARGERPIRDGAEPTAARDELKLALAVVALLALVCALSVVGAGAVARPVFMLSALAVAMLAKRRSPWLYLSASLWVWLTTAFVRRMIEWHGGFNASDLVLATPSLTALPIVADMLTCRGLLSRRSAGYALLLFGCVLYGLFVSFVRGDLLAGCFAAVDWVVPPLYLFLFICHAERIDAAERHLGVFLGLSLSLVVPYALYQYFLMPEWDANWMIASRMGSLGTPLPMGSRVFGSLNNPGFLAIWIGTCLVWLSHFRDRLLIVLTPLLILLLAITMVRSVYGSLTLALAVGALFGRGGFGRLVALVLVAGASAYLAVAALDPRVIEQIALRLRTVSELSTDGSAQIRAAIYTETPRLIDENPFGVGIGAQGRGKAAEGGRDVNTINVDSGPLSVFLALGWAAGPLYILGIGLLQCRALAIGRRRDAPIASVMAAAAICPLGTFPFLNVLGFAGVVLWICLGYVLAVEIRATERQRAPVAPRGAAPLALARLPR
jgi:hypothetical protein